MLQVRRLILLASVVSLTWVSNWQKPWVRKFTHFLVFIITKTTLRNWVLTIATLQDKNSDKK